MASLLVVANLALACVAGDDPDAPGGAAPEDAGGPPSAAGGGSGDGAVPLVACGPEGPTVVFDIDETLTLSDEELILQFQDAAYEPLAREGGPGLVGAYAARGYFVLYLTARSEEMVLSTGETVRDATLRWLGEQGFPTERVRLALAPTNAMVTGEPAAAYKTSLMEEMQQAGFELSYAYGNADSDIAAYEAVGIDKSATFIIGALAGARGTVAVSGEGWVEHRASQMPTVAEVCRP